MAERNKYPYSVSQRLFIEKIRAQVDADPNFFHANNWRCVNPPHGKYSSLMKAVSAETFYVRPVAIWLPERLIPNFVPTCPRCKSNQHVEVSKARWQNSPKVLFGVNGYRYLDTKLYPCCSCRRQFAGYGTTHSL